MDNKTFLEHYGKLGMHWGHRKNQGTTTIIRAHNSEDHDKRMALKGKKLSEMTNDELRMYTQRMTLEKSYKELSKNDISRSKKIVNSLINSVQKSATDAALNYVNKHTAKLVDDMLKKATKAVT